MRTDEELLQLKQNYNIGTPNTDTSEELKGSSLLSSLTDDKTTDIRQPDNTKKQGVGEGLLLGVGKGIVSTARGLSSLGEKTITGIGRLVTPKSLESQFGFEKKDKTAAEQLISEESIIANTKAERVGKFIEQVAEFAVPATKVAKVTKGTKLVSKIGARALTSGSVATAQEGKIGKGTAIAGGTEIALPGAGKLLKPVGNVIARLFTGLGSALSGVSTDALKMIASNPITAKQISKKIIQEGQESVLEKNAKIILEGVSNIRKQARSAYGKALESLSTKDIHPGIIFNNLTKSLKKNNIVLKKLQNRKGFGAIDFSNSEIFNVKIRSKAKGIIADINDLVEADGKQVRRMMAKIDSSKFKTTGGDPDRLAFNVLMNDLSSGLKKSVSKSTSKLNNINKQFSQEMNLAEGIESIFGKVKFKSTTELNRVAKKLERLFSQKGLDPKTVDNFLNRIKISSEEFRTAEAVRGVVSKTSGVNTKGLSWSELLQQITSSVVTPTMVKNISITSGITSNVISAIVKNASPTGRAAIIKSLMNKESE